MDQATIADLLSTLVKINSINPELVPDGAGEGEIASFIANWLSQAGLEVSLEEVRPGRPNVIAWLRGSGGGHTLMLNGHMDTVGVSGMHQPFFPRIENSRLYARGAYDMKAGVAALMLAMKQAQTVPLRGNVVFTAVMDEEFAGLGTLDIATRYQADAALIAEPTEEQLILAHKGFCWFEIETRGIAAHGSRPDLGEDAIMHMGNILVALDNLNLQYQNGPSHPMLGCASLHASLITGGQELSSYPERCILQIECRTIPGQSPESVEFDISSLLDQIKRTNSSFNATLRQMLYRAPMETPSSSTLPTIVTNAVKLVKGEMPTISGVPYWTDAASLDQAGIPAVLFGPIGSGAHSIEESVDLESVLRCASIYLRTIMDFCS